MTQRATGRQAEIETLLGERRKYEVWLAQLEERRASAAPHVFDRVREDYEARLRDVRDRLAAEAGTIAEMVERLEARLGEEQAAVATRVDERAEAELRAAVGEFSEKEWAAKRSRLDSEVAELRAAFDATERELAELKDLLRSAAGVPPAPRPSQEAAAATAVAAALEEAGGANADRIGATSVPQRDELVNDPGRAGSADVASPVAVNDAAYAGEVAADPGASGAAEHGRGAAVAPGRRDGPGASGRPSAPEAADVPPRAATPFDEMAFLRAVSETPARPSRTTGAAQQAAVPEPPPDAPLGGPTPRTSQAVRSLKCGECGTLNFATEWYCERCGGELAAF